MGLAVVILALLAAAALGVALARRPLSRPGFWRLHGAVVAALCSVIGPLLLAENPGRLVPLKFIDALFGAAMLALLLLGLLLGLWSARRLIDIGRPRWWALLALPLFPASIILLGLPPTHPAARESALLEAFR